MLTPSATRPVVRITASAPAIARLAQALFTWKGDETYFVVHLAEMNGQDAVCMDALEFLRSVAVNVDESYRSWWDLERDFGKDHANIRAHVELAIGHATVV